MRPARLRCVLSNGTGASIDLNPTLTLDQARRALVGRRVVYVRRLDLGIPLEWALLCPARGCLVDVCTLRSLEPYQAVENPRMIISHLYGYSAASRSGLWSGIVDYQE